jgi:predicted RNase H-like HicB family nuclease
MSDDRAYRVLVGYDREKDCFVASVPELDIARSAASRGEAVLEAEQAIEQRIAAAVADKEPLPGPADSRAVSGTLALKIADALHREILFHATASHMAPEEFASQLLARAVGALDGARASQRRGRAPESRQGPVDAGDDGLPPRASERSDAHDDRDGRDERDRRGGRVPRRREGYRPDLDDKANFLEYLRGLEKGGGNQGGGRGRR